MIAPWVISHFPEHHTYVEPFMGGAAVLLRKTPAPFEVLNDLDSNVVNYFRVLREQPLDLKRLVDRTPFSREEAYASCEPTEDRLEAARRFHIRAWQTMHGAPHIGKSGWRFGRRGGNDKRSAVDDWNDTDRMPELARRLKSVQIEHDDALKVIPRFDSERTLFFCDPPYLMSTRSDRWARNGYTHEVPDRFHRDLAKVLKGIKGMAIVAGYPSELYEKLYRKWKFVSIKGLSFRNGGSHERQECLWISPKACARGPQRDLWSKSSS